MYLHVLEIKTWSYMVYVRLYRYRRKSHDHGLGLWPRLYAGSVTTCTAKIAEAAYAAVVSLYKWTLQFFIPMCFRASFWRIYVVVASIIFFLQPVICYC